mgnify:CR=1
MTGQESLELEPGKDRVVAAGTCPGDCTKRKFTETVYIKSAHLHMHYLGK